MRKSVIGSNCVSEGMTLQCSSSEVRCSARAKRIAFLSVDTNGRNILPSLTYSHLKSLSHWRQNDLQTLIPGINLELTSLAFRFTLGLFTEQR